MYALVLLKKVADSITPLQEFEHKAFIGGLIRDNAILLGGKFRDQDAPYLGAYILNCTSIEEARKIALKDPYCFENRYIAEVLEWSLVGINPNAIEQQLIRTAEDL